MRAVFAATTIALVLGAAWACLPDLEIGQPASVCGDGFIDPDAGEQCDPGQVGDAAGASNACVNCKVACVVGGYSTFEDPATQHCYFQVGETATGLGTPTAATGECEAWGGHVVRFASEAELALVAANAATDPFWVGINRTAAGVWHPLETTVEPGWAADCIGCFAQVDGGTIPMDPAETDPDGTCVIGFIAPAQSWIESQCSAPKKPDFFRQTICEREPLGSRARACGANVCLSVAATQGSKRYVVVGNPTDGGLGANDAVLACSAQGGRLAVLGSREEREQLGYAIGAYFGAGSSGWIGLSDTNGEWGWDAPDAGGMTPPPWGEGEPAFIDGGVGVGRAYVLIDPTRLDSELAHAASTSDAGGEVHAALCEIP
jgi:hypothetical protein